MKEKKDCKIVQDLLPSYIDKLTSKETNTYIEEHINNCKECKGILDTMQKDIPEENKKIEKKKIKYIKKYNHKLRMLKISLLSIVAIIVIVFVAFPGRKMMIIAELQDNFKEYEQKSDNVYIKFSYYDSSSLSATHEYYYKGDKIKYIMTSPEQNSKVTQYLYPDESKSFVEGPEGKTLTIESRDNIQATPLINILYYDSLKESFRISMEYKITTEIFNGKECYIFTRTNKEEGSEVQLYVEKDTGLILQIKQKTGMNEQTQHTSSMIYEYSFGIVTDEDMQEPDAAAYAIVNY